jgi:hypothetical protein
MTGNRQAQINREEKMRRNEKRREETRREESVQAYNELRFLRQNAVR